MGPGSWLLAIEKDLINEDDVDKFMMCATADCKRVKAMMMKSPLELLRSFIVHDFLSSQPDIKDKPSQSRI